MLQTRSVENKPVNGSLRVTAMGVALVAAIASFILVLHAGRHNRSFLLPLLFVFWTLSPLVALFIAARLSRSWSMLRCTTLYSLMLLISLGSLFAYSGLLTSPGSKPAFIFLITPLVSWLLIVTGLPIAASVSRRKLKRSQA